MVRTLDFVRLQVVRDRDGHGQFLPEAQFLRERGNRRARPKHERRVQSLDPQLTRELDPRGTRGRKVHIRVVAREEEVALRGERHRRVVHPRDVRRRHPRVADATPQRRVGCVQRRRQHRVVCVRSTDGVPDRGDSGEPCPRPVRDQDLPVREVHQLGHHAVLEHVLDLPPRLDALFC